MTASTKIKNIVADSGAFIRNAPLMDIGENVYTIPEVISESCDRATRRRLKLLPIDLKFKEPSGESLLFVSNFAKKTGDYKSLSSVDLKILALTYELEKQYKGTDHIRKEPSRKPEWTGGQISTSASGLLLASRQYADGETLPSNIIGNKGDDESDDEEFYDAPSSLDDDETMDGSGDATEIALSKGAFEQHGEEENMEDESDDEEEEDDDEGWITPANLNDVKRSMGVETAETQVCVGCLTTDFAMQNCLIQMGLHVISVDGMLIKKAKSYVLRCFGCMRITKDTSKEFCPHCGNKTLKRLSTTIEEDGSVRYWLAKNFTIRTRGTKYSLPKPQGGKHGLNPMLFEDQPMPQQRPSKKSQQKVDILSGDVIAGMSPFKVNDVTSRAAQLGIIQRTQPQWAKRNPNENRKTGNKRRGKK